MNEPCRSLVPAVGAAVGAGRGSRNGDTAAGTMNEGDTSGGGTPVGRGVGGDLAFVTPGGIDHQSAGSFASYDSEGEEPSTATNGDRRDTGNPKDLNDNGTSRQALLGTRNKLDPSGEHHAKPTPCAANQQPCPEEGLTMNISTEYAPTTDGMRRPYSRASYYAGRYYAGSLGPDGPSEMGPVDGHSTMRRHQMSPAMVENFGGPGGSYGGDRSFYAPVPLSSVAYPTPPGSSSAGEEPRAGYDYYGAPSFAHPGRMASEFSMYGGAGSYAPWYQPPATPFHQHQHQHQQQHHHHHQHSATPRGYPMPPEHMYNMFNFNR
uniref:Uncharacterized protein n=1 Tax=Anopheles farauti TaxID=69004 RepID=A0A182QEJ6_9DIPT